MTTDCDLITTLAHLTALVRMAFARRFAALATLTTAQHLRRMFASKVAASVPPIRAFFYVPGSEERMIAKASSLGADCVVLDLEDAVAASKKDQARKVVAGALQRMTFGRSQVLVRVNGLGTPHALADLAELAPLPQIAGFVLPKVESAADLNFVRQCLQALRRDHPAHLVAMIESASAVVRLGEIAAVPGLSALVFGAEDYTSDIGGVRTPAAHELLYARSAVVTHAKAFGLQAIDMVCVHYKDEAVLRSECEQGFGMGFTGKQTIHPAQIPVVHATFVPAAKHVALAKRILAAYEAAASQGVGTFTVDDKMIDMPVIKWAQSVVARAALAGGAPGAGV